MAELRNIEVIREFTNGGRTCGVYSLNFNGKQEIFVRNGDSVGVITHFVGEKADKCISIIRDDVRQEFIKARGETS